MWGCHSSTSLLENIPRTRVVPNSTSYRRTKRRSRRRTTRMSGHGMRSGGLPGRNRMFTFRYRPSGATQKLRIPPWPTKPRMPERQRRPFPVGLRLAGYARASRAHPDRYAITTLPNDHKAANPASPNAPRTDSVIVAVALTLGITCGAQRRQVDPVVIRPGHGSFSYRISIALKRSSALKTRAFAWC